MPRGRLLSSAPAGPLDAVGDGERGRFELGELVFGRIESGAFGEGQDFGAEGLREARGQGLRHRLFALLLVRGVEVTSDVGHRTVERRILGKRDVGPSEGFRSDALKTNFDVGPRRPLLLFFGPVRSA